MKNSLKKSCWRVDLYRKFAWELAQKVQMRSLVISGLTESWKMTIIQFKSLSVSERQEKDSDLMAQQTNATACSLSYFWELVF